MLYCFSCRCVHFTWRFSWQRRTGNSCRFIFPVGNPWRFQWQNQELTDQTSPDRNYRQGLFPVGHPTGNSTLSWRAVPVGWFLTVGCREKHSWWFFGYSWWFLADRNFPVSGSDWHPNLLQRLMDLESKMKHLVANQTQLYIGLSTKLKPNSCSGFLMVAASSKPDPTNSWNQLYGLIWFVLC